MIKLLNGNSLKLTSKMVRWRELIYRELFDFITVACFVYIL